MSQKNSSKHMLSIKIFHQITLVFNGMKHGDFGFGFTNNYGFEDGKVCQAWWMKWLTHNYDKILMMIWDQRVKLKWMTSHEHLTSTIQY